MPREVKAYACKFKCGRNVLTHHDRMQNHERICRLNPERKTCMTCRHDTEDFVDCGEYDRKTYECEIDKKPGHGSGPNSPNIVWDCPHWEMKES